VTKKKKKQRFKAYERSLSYRCPKCRTLMDTMWVDDYVKNKSGYALRCPKACGYECWLDEYEGEYHG
jgi:hypothetical protein